MTPLMERVILTMQAFGDSEVSLDQIRKTGKFDSGREVAVCLHYLVNREGLATVRDVGSSTARPAVWKLTDLGRLYRPLLTLGAKSDAEATAPTPAREVKPNPRKAPNARPKKSEPAGTVADLVQEIKAEQDAGRVKGLDTNGDARLVKLVEEANRAIDEKYDFRPSHVPERKLDLTLGSDGMLEIVVPDTDFSMLLTPGQTSQLGEFLMKTSGVWQSPF